MANVGSRGSAGFRYDGSTLATINPLPIDGSTDAVAINNAGAIAGVSYAVTSILHAVVVAPGSMTPVPIGSLDGTAANTNFNSFSSAYAINATGQVSGEAYITLGGAASAKHAFLWTSGGTDGVAANPQMKDLGVLSGKTDSHARGMNDAGIVVGYSDSSSSPKAAFVYSGGVMSNLKSLVDSSGTDWTLTEADDVNNAGQIVGLGTFGGNTHGFLLTPVPEPGTALSALFAGFTFVASRRLRAR